MKQVEIFAGDNRDTLRRLIDEGVQVDSVVTDPPYGISFMGKGWDNTSIERDPEFWKLILEILKPGGYCFAFSAARTGHWQACAMEMAGFVMHPMHGWVYGTGFPKAQAADKAIDRHLGAVREVLGTYSVRGFSDTSPTGDGRNKWAAGEVSKKELFITAPGSPEAAEWEGWAYGTQAQKPALEPIYLAQKPFSEKTGATNILKHGVGAVNIDGCRVSLGANDALQGGVKHTERKLDTADNEGTWGFKAVDRAAGLGRHPSNLILDGSPEVLEMFPQSNSARANGNPNNPKRGKNHSATSYGQGDDTVTNDYRDSGSAARFFHQFPPDMNPIFYQTKASKKDRDGSKHPTVKPIALMQYLVRHVTPHGGTVLDPFAGSGSTGVAAIREGMKCILMEREPEYVEFLKDRFDNLDDHHGEGSQEAEQPEAESIFVY